MRFHTFSVIFNSSVTNRPTNRPTDQPTDRQRLLQRCFGAPKNEFSQKKPDEVFFIDKTLINARVDNTKLKLILKLNDLFITLRPLRLRPLEVFSPTQSSIQQYSSQNFQRKTNEMMNSTRLISQSVNVYTYVADKNFLSITNMTTQHWRSSRCPRQVSKTKQNFTSGVGLRMFTSYAFSHLKKKDNEALKSASYKVQYVSLAIKQDNRTTEFCLIDKKQEGDFGGGGKNQRRREAGKGGGRKGRERRGSWSKRKDKRLSS